MPQFTPLQFKLHIKDHHDLGVHLVSKEPVEVDRPTPVTLRDRIPASASASTSASASGTTTNINITRSAMADQGPPSLPSVANLPAAPIKTIINVLDLLFEHSTDLHALALPAIQSSRRSVPANPGLSSDLPPPAGAPRATIPNPDASKPPPYASYSALIDHVGSLLYKLSESTTPEAKKKLHGILGAHPRLGAKKVDSAQSQAEQAQLHAGGAGEAEKLKALNEEYEAKFPGLRYVVFVNGRSRPVVMENMRERIDRGDIKEEEREAIKAMVDIAKDRAEKLETVG